MESNRRNFITAAIGGLAWLCGVRPLPKVTAPAPKPFYVLTLNPRKLEAKMHVDGGFLVPAEFAEAIESRKSIIGRAVCIRAIGPPLTIEEVCKARGISP